MKKSEDLRIKYNKMVDDINKKLSVIEGIDKDSITLDRYRKYFKKVSTKNPNLKKMERMYKQAQDVLKSGELSKTGYIRAKANAVKTLRNEGYTFINKNNINNFFRFLDDARARGIGALYSSTQLLEVWNESKKQKLSDTDIINNMNRWTKDINQDKEGKIIEVVKPKKLRFKK